MLYTCCIMLYKCCRITKMLVSPQPGRELLSANNCISVDLGFLTQGLNRSEFEALLEEVVDYFIPIFEDDDRYDGLFNTLTYFI